MDTIAALVPPLVVALAFIAIGRAVLRSSDRHSGSADVVDADAADPVDRGGADPVDPPVGPDADPGVDRGRD